MAGCDRAAIEIELTAAPVQRRSSQWTISDDLRQDRRGRHVAAVPPFEPTNVGFGLEYGTAFIEQGVSPTETVGNCPETGGAVGICNLGDTNPGLSHRPLERS